MKPTSDLLQGASDHALTRRRFLASGAGAVVAASCLPSFRPPATALAPPTNQGTAARTYVCPPCGLECDKLVFDKPGTCPQCGMTLVPADGGAGAPPTVAILIFNGAEIIDFAGPWEAFGTAGFLVHTVAENLEPHTMVFGQKVLPDYTFENSPKADILLVPGGGVGPATDSRPLIEWLQAKAHEVSHVMSVCTGAFLLAKAGLLDGLSATTTYGMEDELSKSGRNITVLSPRRFVDAGKIVTTAGLTSGIDGALHLISKILGTGYAQSAALDMEYQWNADSSFARAALADRYLPDGLQFGKPRVKGAQATMLSTEGDTNRWETRVLVSQPNSTTEVVDLLRARIKANTGHTRGPVEFTAPGANRSASVPEIRWRFTDDHGHGWRGVGIAEPSPDDKGKIVVTLKLMREGHA
jgi:putative intracellular protease/amidase